MTTITRPVGYTTAFVFILINVFVSNTVFASEALVLPIWSDLYNADGTLKDAVDATGAPGPNGVPDCADQPYVGVDAVFIGDDISNGVATDMSALSDAANLEDVVVFNGTVASTHDVGNAFVFARTDGPSADLIIYGAAERLASPSGTSYVEFEFTQQKVQAIGAGVPLHGGRTTDDLLIRLNVALGALSSAQIMRWTSAGSYQTVVTVAVNAGTACSGDGQSHLVCDPYLASGEFDYITPFDPWSDSPRDMTNTPVTVPLPNGLLEFGINVAQLLGSNPNYTSILVRTPEDIILDNFRNLGFWAEVPSASGSRTGD